MSLLLLGLLACQEEKPDTGDTHVDTAPCEPFTVWADVDGDGYGDSASPLDGCESLGVGDSSDCDDSDGEVHPLAAEDCNGRDDDCDGTTDESGGSALVYADRDGDGFGDPTSGSYACSGLADASDCDDDEASTHPGAGEVCDGADDDCDGLVDEDDPDLASVPSWYPDGDGDGYGAASADPFYACEAPEGHAASRGDCDDGDPEVWPGWGTADMDCDGRPGVSVAAASARFLGELSLEYAGTALSVADVDGDGAVEAWFGSGTSRDPGRLYGVPGSIVPSGGTVLLADTSTQVSGTEDFDLLGYYHLWLRDIDGDGVTDLLAGAPGSDVAGAGAGAVYLFPGADLASALTDERDITAGDPWMSGAEGEGLGNLLASLGDVDGDGLEDVVIGGAELGGGAGRAYVFAGATLSGHLGGLSSEDAATVIEGEATERTYVGYSRGDRLGADLDGDGLAEVALAATGADQGEGDEGAILLFSGAVIAAGGTLSMSEADATWRGVNRNGYLGESLTFTGDLDGDGVAEIAASAQMTGAVYVLEGTRALTTSVSTVEEAWLEVAPERGRLSSDTLLGRGLATADVDADGVPDLLVSDPYFAEWVEEDRAGRTYLFLGAGLAGGVVTAELADAIFTADKVETYLGFSVTGAGDVDGDGAEDLLIGDRSDGETAQAGRTSLLLSPW